MRFALACAILAGREVLRFGGRRLLIGECAESVNCKV
jgi:hypothetical protein